MSSRVWLPTHGWSAGSGRPAGGSAASGTGRVADLVAGVLRRRDRGPRMGTADPADLGVHAPASSRWVERDIDARLEAAVGSARVVVAVGPRLAGTTHALAHAAGLLLGDHALVRPDAPPGDAAGLAALARGSASPAGEPVVLWLDDVPAATLAAIGATAADGGLPPGVRVLATARADLVHPDVCPDLGGATVVAVPGTLSDAEARRAGELGWRPGDVPGHRALLKGSAGGTDGALADARAALHPTGASGGTAALHTAAVLRAVADWDRLRVADVLDRATLARLAAGYADDLDPREDAADPEDLLDAVDLLLADPDGPLRRLARGSRTHHAPGPALAAAVADLTAEDATWIPPVRLTALLDDRLAAPVERRAVGLLALHVGVDALALRLLDDVAPSAVSTASAYGAGLAALESGDAAGARRWFAAVAGSGAGSDPEVEESTPADPAGYRARAAFWLGVDPDTPPDERRAHLAVVVAEGPAADRADAAYMLAALERDAGHADERRHWLRVATEAALAGNDERRRADALVELAHLDWSTGAVDAARDGFAEAVRIGDSGCRPEAMMALGTIAAETGDDEGARRWYQRAAEAGTPALADDVPRQRDTGSSPRPVVDA